MAFSHLNVFLQKLVHLLPSLSHSLFLSLSHTPAHTLSLRPIPWEGRYHTKKSFDLVCVSLTFRRKKLETKKFKREVFPSIFFSSRQILSPTLEAKAVLANNLTFKSQPNCLTRSWNVLKVQFVYWNGPEKVFNAVSSLHTYKQIENKPN